MDLSSLNYVVIVWFAERLTSHGEILGYYTRKEDADWYASLVRSNAHDAQVRVFHFEGD